MGGDLADFCYRRLLSVNSRSASTSPWPSVTLQWKPVTVRSLVLPLMASGDKSTAKSEDEQCFGVQAVDLSDESDDDGPGVLNAMERMPAGLPRSSRDATMTADDVLA